MAKLLAVNWTVYPSESCHKTEVVVPSCATLPKVILSPEDSDMTAPECSARHANVQQTGLTARNQQACAVHLTSPAIQVEQSCMDGWIVFYFLPTNQRCDEQTDLLPEHRTREDSPNFRAPLHLMH